MLSTKIGKVVNKLRNHDDEDIKKAAKKVYIKWRTHFEDHLERPMLEVQCDLKTEKLRTSGRKLLADALSLEESHKLPETIEREAFQQNNRRMNNPYKRTIRALVFTLKNQEDVRAKIISGETTVTNFVKENLKSL